ncbi:MAG: ankyrin repeat domain-containing protein [Bacteroidales bacterium]
MNTITKQEDLDSWLFNLINSHQPSEKSIRELVSQGANINALNKNKESVLTEALDNIQFGLDTNIIKLLIELGADLNYQPDDGGFNCLFYACLDYNVELVQILLKAGADPNCIDTEGGPESLLDWAIFEQWFQENHYAELGKPMEKIVSLLLDYGAKTLVDLNKAKQQP